MSLKISNIIFDLGGVLIDWNPRHLYSKLIEDPAEMEKFLTGVCSLEWNSTMDAGLPFKEAIAERIGKFPQFKELIQAYHDRWHEMFSGAIEENVRLLENLDKKGYALFALTNWSGETFPWAKRCFPFLSRFRDVVVSGDEKLIKPDPRIFQRLLSRNGLEAASCVFIDDVERNANAAAALGINAIWYRSHAQLVEDLARYNIKA